MSTTATHHVAPDAKISGHVTANTAYIQFDEYATFSVSLGSLLTPAEKVALLERVSQVAEDLREQVELADIEAGSGEVPC